MPLGLDGTTSGWFNADEIQCLDECGAPWVTTTFNLGDVCILGLDTVHRTGANTLEQLRISCDTRWQPVDDSIDPRLGVVNEVKIDE